MNTSIPYSLKRNFRSRQVKLHITQHGLVLTVPILFNEKYIPRILEEHKTWIEEQYHNMQLDKAAHAILPTEIPLFAIQQTWQIKYIHTYNSFVKIISRPQQELVLLGNIKNITKCKKLLLMWLREQGRLHLGTWLNRLSDQTQLNFNRVNIRSQHSRWGSCSREKNITLNDRLVFLPKQLVSYVLLHELCHTKHLNHSAAFWKMLAQWDPNFAQHRRALRGAQTYIPTWI